jgi:hypothetical protein
MRQWIQRKFFDECGLLRKSGTGSTAANLKTGRS